MILLDEGCCDNEVVMVVWCDVIIPPANEARYIREEKTQPIFVISRAWQRLKLLN